MAEDLDELDWSVLRELQNDGRVSVAELARRIRLSPTATADRVRRLENRGVITGYAARVNLSKLGVGVLAIVRLQYPGRAREPLARLLDKRRQAGGVMGLTTAHSAGHSWASIGAMLGTLARRHASATAHQYTRETPVP